MTTNRNNNLYRCQVTLEDGTVVYSEPATLTMDAPVNITAAPADNTTLEGSKAPFTVEADNVRAYRWYYRRNAEDSWHPTAMTGYTTNTLQVLVTANRDGYQYMCSMAGVDGTISNTEPATLYVTKCIQTQPTNKAAQIGETAVFTVEAQNVKSYQWIYRVNAESGWNNTGMDGNQTASLKVPMTAKRAGYQYKCKLTNNDGSILYTKEVTLFAAPKVTQQPTDVTVTTGEAAVFTVEATEVVSYQWQYSKNGGESWSNTSATGNTTPTLTVTNTKDGYMYRCAIVGAEKYVVYTDAVTLTVVE